MAPIRRPANWKPVRANGHNQNCLFNIIKLNGAPEENNLEPFEYEQLLSELENWTDVLKANPEVIRQLSQVDQQQSDADPEEIICDLPGMEP